MISKLNSIDRKKQKSVIFLISIKARLMRVAVHDTYTHDHINATEKGLQHIVLNNIA